MGLTNKSEGEQQLMPNNSDAPNEDQDKIDSSVLQQGSEHEEEAHSHPDINCLHVGHLQHPPMEQSTFQESFHGLSKASHDISHCLKAHVKEIGLPIILHLSALSTLLFHLPFLPTLLFLSFFLLSLLLLLLLIILFTLVF
ncbi:hypothetical protein DBR06_SOUSAS49410004 [Sousa chinensis]|nr:hypothetical protein DBR06_SOUSAS49410004 [Sousa chinensis]